jgi:hypothetical protein
MVNCIEEFESTYWEYYLSIENEFKQINNHIPIDVINENTYSISYMKLIFAICSEIDVIFKELINFINAGNANNIRNYYQIIISSYNNFTNELLNCFENRQITPFAGWNKNTTMDWWTDYNKIKHERTSIRNGIQNFKKSNQKNVLNALGGLYQLEMYFYKEIINRFDPNKTSHKKIRIPLPQSSIFRINNWADNIPLADDRFTFYLDQGNLIWDGKIK